ncbi:MAG: thioredoxin domain-containing protein, partial [Proteobacteria bacterium]|nr:thioredoxin domain-containing protein [Pseudomonadota bacterium]
LGNANTIYLDNYLGHARIIAGSKELVRFKSDGKVGIGTSSPDAKLHLKGSNNSWIDGILLEQVATPQKYSISSREGGKFSISDETTLLERFVILNNGNIGIGTSSPSSKLAIQRASGSDVFGEIYNSDGTYWTRFNSNSTAGSYNSLVQAGDHSIIYSNGTIDTGGLTLGQWSRGGIYDHLGGGFHRYSTDKRWFVPHFEKMLYDNALVTQLYLEAFQATQKVQYAKTARETLDYVLRQMTHSQGGYFSTEDADSEGIEGKFYVWSLSEVESILDKETAQLFCEAYGITKHGNWEENNILHLPTELSQFCQNKNIELAWLEDSLEKAKRKLLDQRNHRIAPNRDEKIIVSWNGLMIEAMAFSFQVLGDTNYLESAQRAAHFILDDLQQTEEGHLHHSFQEGRAQFNALLDDYACFANGLLSLFESDFNSLWISQAEKLLKLMLREFWDESQNTFFYTPKTHEALILRPKEFQDGALPSASGMAITALARLGKLTGNPLYLEHAEKALKSHRDFLQQAPMACGQMLLALELIGPGSKEIIIIPEKSDETVETALDYLRSTFYPNKIIALKTEENAHLALFKNRTSLNGTTTLYICENQTCLTPITDVELLKGLLSG